MSGFTFRDLHAVFDDPLATGTTTGSGGYAGVTRGGKASPSPTPTPAPTPPPYVMEKDRPLLCLCEKIAVERVVGGKPEVKCPCGRRLRGDARAWRLWIRSLASERIVRAYVKAQILCAPAAKSYLHMQKAGDYAHEIPQHVSKWARDNILKPEYEKLTEAIKSLDRVLVSTQLDEEAVLETLAAPLDGSQK